VSSSLRKGVEEIIEAIQRQGWRVRRGSKHYMVYPADPTKPPVAIPCTPSDHRSLLNIRADLRRRGARL